MVGFYEPFRCTAGGQTGRERMNINQLIKFESKQSIFLFIFLPPPPLCLYPPHLHLAHTLIHYIVVPSEAKISVELDHFLNELLRIDVHLHFNLIGNRIRFGLEEIN